MNIKKERDGEVLYAFLEGSMQYNDKDKFKDVAFAFSRNGIRQVILDFSGLDYIDSNGIGMLLVMHEDAAQNEGEILIRNMKGMVAKLFEMSELRNMFNIQ